MIGQLEVVEDGVLLKMRAVSLAWAARYLISLFCPLSVLHPPELREELRQVAKAIMAMANEHVSPG